ncbi:MAG: PTS sugar transporter subunit IIA [Nannocystaceae bacterium]|nr:PTS sugar transporter subunit IIA [Nannocystaceae bacterium]
MFEPLRSAAVIPRLQARDVAGALRELAAALARAYGVDADATAAALREPLANFGCALGHGLALPHARDAGHAVRIAVGLAPAGLPFAAPDDEPVRVVVAMLSPREGPAHLEALAAIGQRFTDAGLRERLLAQHDADAIVALLHWG